MRNVKVNIKIFIHEYVNKTRYWFTRLFVYPDEIYTVLKNKYKICLLTIIYTDIILTRNKILSIKYNNQQQHFLYFETVLLDACTRNILSRKKWNSDDCSSLYVAKIELTHLTVRHHCLFVREINKLGLASYSNTCELILGSDWSQS